MEFHRKTIGRTSKEDPHLDPFVCWHHQVFYPCLASKHTFGGHNSPRSIPAPEGKNNDQLREIRSSQSSKSNLSRN